MGKSRVLANIAADTTANIRSSLELGSIATQQFGNVCITGGTVDVTTVCATTLYGDGSNLTGIATGFSDACTITGSGTVSPDATQGTFFKIRNNSAITISCVCNDTSISSIGFDIISNSDTGGVTLPACFKVPENGLANGCANQRRVVGYFDKVGNTYYGQVFNYDTIPGDSVIQGFSAGWDTYVANCWEDSSSCFVFGSYCHTPRTVFQASNQDGVGSVNCFFRIQNQTAAGCGSGWGHNCSQRWSMGVVCSGGTIYSIIGARACTLRNACGDHGLGWFINSLTPTGMKFLYGVTTTCHNCATQDCACVPLYITASTTCDYMLAFHDSTGSTCCACNKFMVYRLSSLLQGVCEILQCFEITNCCPTLNIVPMAIPYYHTYENCSTPASLWFHNPDSSCAARCAIYKYKFWPGDGSTCFVCYSSCCLSMTTPSTTQGKYVTSPDGQYFSEIIYPSGCGTLLSVRDCCYQSCTAYGLTTIGCINFGGACDASVDDIPVISSDARTIGYFGHRDPTGGLADYCVNQIVATMSPDGTSWNTICCYTGCACCIPSWGYRCNNGFSHINRCCFGSRSFGSSNCEGLTINPETCTLSKCSTCSSCGDCRCNDGIFYSCFNLYGLHGNAIIDSSNNITNPFAIHPLSDSTLFSLE